MCSDRRVEAASVDPTVPSVARIYDVFLGGKNNFEADLEAAERLLIKFAEVQPAARRNRAALARAVRWAVMNGVRQVIDIGSGYPWTEVDDPELQPLHQQVATIQTSPPVRFVYVDNDPVVLAHDRALARDTAVVNADLHDPELLDHQMIQAHVDFSEPVVLVLGAILHFVPDEDDPAGLVQRLAERLVPGSLVIISHATADELTPDRVAAAHSVYENTSQKLVFRSRGAITALFGSLQLEQSGVTRLDEWHPECAPPGTTTDLTPAQSEENQLGSTWLNIGTAYVTKTPEPDITADDGISSVPNIARLFATYQGERTELTSDERKLISDVRSAAPEASRLAKQSQLFAARAVRELAGRGVRQFLDLGCGIPASDMGVHQIAQRAGADDARVVYIDSDADVVERQRAALGETPGVAVITADIRRVEDILKDRDVRQLIDLTQPVALVASMVLHCIRDADAPAAIIAGFRNAMAPGSYLILSHITEGDYPEEARAAATAYARYRASTPMVLRPAAEIRGFFDGFDLLPPGLVAPVEWWPDVAADWADLTAPKWVLAGVGRIVAEPLHPPGA